MKVEFTVPGIPVGKGRPRFMKNGHTYNDDSTIAALTVWKYQTTGASRVEVTIEEEKEWML